jgi:hypothetical protein
MGGAGGDHKAARHAGGQPAGYGARRARAAPFIAPLVVRQAGGGLMPERTPRTSNAPRYAGPPPGPLRRRSIPSRSTPPISWRGLRPLSSVAWRPRLFAAARSSAWWAVEEDGRVKRLDGFNPAHRGAGDACRSAQLNPSCPLARNRVAPDTSDTSWSRLSASPLTEARP